MRVPLSLVKSFISLEIPVATICETLTLLGIEVDSVINEQPPFARVIVGEVLSVTPHPHAKKLQIAQVHDGKRAVQVVCGAENCRPGIKTAFAQVGAVLKNSDGSQRILEKISLREVESFGMLCSASELNLWKGDSGILELPLDWENGHDLTSLLWDPILEVSLTPNLGHCLSALGIARELGAGLKKKVHRPSFASPSQIEKRVQIKVEDPKLCPRYMCRLIENVVIAPSPFWLQKELLACGLKPICNAVDITNYILLKTGQPLHAFDFDLLDGAALRIAKTQHAEEFLGLDGVARTIAPGTLVIADAKKSVAIAGVLGGQKTAVHTGTQNILLEAAYFDPVIVRQGAKKAGLRTESALRFEKGVDPNGVEAALNEATTLIATLCKGHPAQAKIDLSAHDFSPKQIACRPERINHLLGTQLSLTEIESILHRLECKTTTKKDGHLLVEVPTYRFDVTEEIDLIEEIVRIYGYNNLEKNRPNCKPSQIPQDPLYLFEKNMRARCIGLGLQEFLTPDLISPKLSMLAQEVMASKGIQLLKAIHAKTEEYSILRPSLLPGLLQVAKGNLDQKNHSFSAFEIGRIHFLQKEKSVEIPILSLLLTGKPCPHNWSTKIDDVDFYTLKGMIENLLDAFRIENVTFHPSNHLSFHPGRQADIRCNDLTIGSFGEVHPKLLAELDIKQRIFFAETDLQHWMALQSPTASFTPIPELPSSERDWTVSLPLSTHIDSVFAFLRSTPSSLLEKIELIDLYQPEGATQKNATFRFTYRDCLKTISYEEVEAEHARLIKNF